MTGDSRSAKAKELVDAHLATLFRYAVHLTRSPEEAEELVQETFLVATERSEQLRESQAALAWLIRILRSRLSRRRRLPALQETVDLDSLAAVEPGRSSLIEDVDQATLSLALEALPADYREPLLLFYFDELRYRDIAEILEVPIGTVMSRIARAKAFLRERLLEAESPTPAGSSRRSAS